MGNVRKGINRIFMPAQCPFYVRTLKKKMRNVRKGIKYIFINLTSVPFYVHPQKKIEEKRSVKSVSSLQARDGKVIFSKEMENITKREKKSYRECKQMTGNVKNLKENV